MLTTPCHLATPPSRSSVLLDLFSSSLISFDLFLLACLLFEAVSHSVDRAGLELSGVLLASAHLRVTDQEL